MVNWIYVGYSTDLKERIERHKAGNIKSTKAYNPLQLVYYEAYLNKTDAAKREYKLKHNSQQKNIKRKNFK